MYMSGEFEVVAELGCGGGYDWSVCQVGRKDGELFYRYGSGCSCTYIEEYDFEPFTWDQIVEATTQVWGVDEAETTEFLSEVAALMKK